MDTVNKFGCNDDSVIAKVYDADVQQRHYSESGLITSHQHRPLMDMCQVGEVIAVGTKLKSDYQIGDIIMFSHAIMDDDFRRIHKEDSFEYRVIFDKGISTEIYGKFALSKKQWKETRVIPHVYYACARPLPQHSMELTRSIFQVQVDYINPADTAARKMGIKVGDWIVCAQNAAYQVIVNRMEFWFVFLEEILAINHGVHKLAVQRHYGSQILHNASRKIITELN